MEGFSNPLAGLDGMIEAFGSPEADIEEMPGFASVKSNLERLRASGRTRWDSEDWMKSREEYQQLDTITLTQECLSRPLFYLQMGIYQDRRRGLLDLVVFHDGFSTLLNREDMWSGVMDYYRSAAAKLRYGEDPREIVLTGETLGELSHLFEHSRRLKDQAMGREREFVLAQVEALNAFDHYFAEAGGDYEMAMLVYSSSIYVARTALMLIESDNKQAFDKIQSGLSSHRLNRKQIPQEVHAFIKDTQHYIETEYFSN